MSQPALHPKLLHPAEDFIAQSLPAWLKAAKPQQLARLQLRFNAYLASQRQMAGFANRHGAPGPFLPSNCSSVPCARTAS
ncbi:hypothetical protein PPS11_25890 [Pseudomonas putida S11]|nr:hypothetical protein PPS11_25890 [Pseudomonas putida S11]